MTNLIAVPVAGSEDQKIGGLKLNFRLRGENAGNSSCTVHMELDPHGFYALLYELEKAKNSLQKLSGENKS